MDFPVSVVLEGVEALSREHLGAAYAPAVAPPVVSGRPGEGVFRVGLGSDGVRYKAVGEGLVVGLEDFFGGVPGGGDDGRD